MIGVLVIVFVPQQFQIATSETASCAVAWVNLSIIQHFEVITSTPEPLSPTLDGCFLHLAQLRSGASELCCSGFTSPGALRVVQAQKTVNSW